MSIRSNWCEYDKETRKYIKKRDKDKCILCGAKGGLQIAHIFLSRAKGGRGCKENGIMLCVKCHQIMDNPIGKEQNKIADAYLNKCKNYLIREEKIEDIKVLQEKLKFNKIEYVKEKAQKQDVQEQKTISNTKYNKKCKDCSMLIKSNNNSTIPSYYCKYRKIRLNKSTKICDKFKEK